MALTFKKPAAKPEPPADELITTLKWPGEIRSAILSGIKFGIYSDRTKRESKYMVHYTTKRVSGFDNDEEIDLGYLAPNEDGALHFHQERVAHPMYTSLSVIFDRYWKLLEFGCRVQPSTELRVYE